MGRSQRELGFAIVGCGLIGHRRFGTLPPGSLRFACDLHLQRAKELAQKSENCTATTEFDAVLSDQAVNVILVATANSALAPLTLSAVRAGKHVLVEKPGAIAARQLKEIELEASASGVLVRIGYNHRFHPAFLRAYQIASSEDVGELMFIRGRYGHGGRLGYDEEWRANPRLSGGGELVDQGVHLIDLAASFMGEFSTVDGHAATYFWDMAVDDNAFIRLRNAEGKTAWLQASCTEWKNLFSFEIYFRRAKLQVEGLGGSYGVERLYYYKMLPEMGPPETTIYEFPRGDQSWKLELEQFLEDIRLGRTPVPGLREGVRALEVVEKIYFRPNAQKQPSHKLLAITRWQLPSMIITRSPLRISLGGGGTDLPSYYEEHSGFLVAAAIDKYVYITLHQTFAQELIIKYSKLERVKTVAEVEHPIIREALKLVDLPDVHLEITSMADIPAGTGLGSSGSFTAALLKALHA